MSNITENRINVVLPATDFSLMNDSLAVVGSKIPANTTLTDNQRIKYNAIDVDNKVFAEDCLGEAQINGGGILAPYINLEHLKNDLTVFKQLDTIESILKNLVRRVADAKRIAGHEAYGQANAIYKQFAVAHKSGIGNASASYQKLKARYDAQGNRGRDQDEPLP